MVYLVIEIILCIILAVIFGFLVGWLLRIWPFWKRFSDYEKQFEINNAENEKKINQIRIDCDDKLKQFQVAYEERMFKFQTEYEEGINNYKNDYADGFSSFAREYKIFEKEMLGVKKELEHKLTEYSSKYYYLENKFKNELTNEDYESSLAELKENLEALEKRIKTHKHSASPVKKKAAPKPAAKKAPPKPVKAKAVKEKDNLKKIYGVGKVLEGMLHKQRIYTFKQIAELTKEDIERISKKLKGFNDRIKRDKWLKQAKQLMKKKK